MYKRELRTREQLESAVRQAVYAELTFDEADLDQLAEVSADAALEVRAMREQIELLVQYYVELAYENQQS